MEWKKSSRSTEQGNCVELGREADAAGVRDSKNPGGPQLSVTPNALTELVRLAR